MTVAAHPYSYEDSPRPDVQALVPDGARSILDVGCGSGTFGGALRTRVNSPEVWGIDTESSIREVAEQRLDRFILGSYPEDAPQRSFECITFCDALEHFADPWETLRYTARLLDETGLIVASIPNLRYYNVVRKLVINGQFDYADTGILDRTHLRFFTRASIMSLFEQTGYVIESITPEFHARPGRAIRALRLLGGLSLDFRATHYNVVARPVCPR